MQKCESTLREEDIDNSSLEIRAFIFFNVVYQLLYITYSINIDIIFTISLNHLHVDTLYYIFSIIHKKGRNPLRYTYW